jgi:hypothetical protein
MVQMVALCKFKPVTRLQPALKAFPLLQSNHVSTCLAASMCVLQGEHHQRCAAQVLAVLVPYQAVAQQAPVAMFVLHLLIAEAPELLVG